MPRALLFDAVGTLIELRRPVGDVYREFARLAGVDLPAWRLTDAFQRVFERANPLDYSGFPHDEAPEREAEWWRQRVRSTFLAADSTVVFDDFAGLFRVLFDFYGTAGAWRLRQGVGETLRSLHTRGHPMGVVSNFDHRLPDLMESLGISLFFEFIMIPSICGSAKPDGLIFQAALDRLAAPPGAVIFVGDDPEKDLAAAAALGCSTLDVRQLPAFGALCERIDALS